MKKQENIICQTTDSKTKLRIIISNFNELQKKKLTKSQQINIWEKLSEKFGKGVSYFEPEEISDSIFYIQNLIETMTNNLKNKKSAFLGTEFYTPKKNSVKKSDEKDEKEEKDKEKQILLKLCEINTEIIKQKQILYKERLKLTELLLQKEMIILQVKQ